MIVAGLQMDIAWEEPEENLRRARDMAGRAVADGARLVALPEMFATGFSMNAAEVSRHAALVRDFLAALARDLDAFVLGGYAEPAEPLPMNACSLFDPEGTELLHYRKIHPFTLAHEERHYGAGDEVLTAAVEGVRVTPVICYDLRFPELFRAAADGTDLFVVIANWPEKRRFAWSALLRARAIENQAFVLGVNRVGFGGGEPHSGDSALLDPFGVPIAEASEEPAVVGGEVDAGAVRSARERFSFLSDRREELYPRLSRPRPGTPPA